MGYRPWPVITARRPALVETFGALSGQVLVAWNEPPGLPTV